MSGSRHDSLNRSMSIESPLSSPTSRPDSSSSLWSTGSAFPRRRSPFVPFALRNQTGELCLFVKFPNLEKTNVRLLVEFFSIPFVLPCLK